MEIPWHEAFVASCGVGAQYEVSRMLNYLIYFTTNSTSLASRVFSVVTLNIQSHKWKNHFYEMKGDVGMSVHEKERKQEDAYTTHTTTQTHS